MNIRRLTRNPGWKRLFYVLLGFSVIWSAWYFITCPGDFACARQDIPTIIFYGVSILVWPFIIKVFSNLVRYIIEGFFLEEGEE